MSKYSEQFKLEAITSYLAGGTSYRVAADKHEIEFGMLRLWVASYRIHGAASLKKIHRRYSPGFKLSVLQRMWRDELSYRETTALFDLRNANQVGIWERQYYSGGIEALTSRKPGPAAKMSKKPSKPVTTSCDADSPSREQLLAEVEYLRMENAYLKKLKALIQADELAARAKKRK